jgi:hypothetical protein
METILWIRSSKYFLHPLNIAKFEDILWNNDQLTRSNPKRDKLRNISKVSRFEIINN